MLITDIQTKAIRRKIADQQLKRYQFANKIGVTNHTVTKILAGNYNAPKRIYASVMEWLVEDY
ncbi:DNA-binding protein [Streptococcus parauberis]|uniref:DNA-binding protein n=1 Tax=Streptococcus parauberis TaxID=1348 RepID=UPI000CCEA31C|nr:DNA-binding protein [Streptococcus parauberis]PNY22381.1 hypothetical protein ASN88_00491 [Streptococcus parauberis]RFE00905.1 hypothetical protein ADO06_01778 [Streptococcus parauberis]